MSNGAGNYKMIPYLMKWLLLLTLACAAQAASPDAAVLEMLRNIQTNGLNEHANKGLGGLWINWRYGSKPFLVNMNGLGQPDAPGAQRHDVLTDLRYLHNLLLYKDQHPADRQFDEDIARFRRIVVTEFTGTHNERGWLYDELIDMYRLSKDAFFRETARSLVRNYATAMARPPAGIYFKTNANHPGGTYRVDLALEIGCALMQAGTEFGERAWLEQGRRMVEFVYDHAYIRKYRTFPMEMDAVTLPDGSLNPNQKIYRDTSGRYKREGGSVRMGSAGQIATSLLHVYMTTRDRAFLDRAVEMLDALAPEQNLLGLWDAKHLGYFASAVFPGPDSRNPGEPRLNSSKKESGRQAHMLEAVVVANRLTGNRYRALEEALVKVVLEKAYYAPGRGILYEQAADWSLLALKGGGVADWVTTEAMGITLEALQQRNRKEPW
jgi:hypothetical protein